VFTYSDDERRIIAEAEARGGYVLDFGAGLRATIEPHVVNLEIADYPTTDVVSMSDGLPFADRTFDGVIALHVLEHVRHPWITAREIGRVLKPDGVAVCTVPFVCAEHGFPDHYFNMTRAGLASLFDDLVLEHQFVKPDGVPINAVQQVLSTYWGNLEEPYRSELGAMTVDRLVNAPLAELVRAGYATQLPAHARWKVAAHTSIVMRKPA
jgi:SAM-dependent methyltransferase